MTSNTPDHEASDRHDTASHDESGVPVEPVQPASTQDVYDGDARAAGDPAADDLGADDLATEAREPYPIGASDAEPAPVTTSDAESPSSAVTSSSAPSPSEDLAPVETARDEELVIDYGSAQEPEAAHDEPPLTKPSPADEQHPYPPQALGEPAPVAGAAAAGAAGATTEAAGDERTSERDASSDRGVDATSRPVYVQAPTPPKTKGNRGFGILIGILATLVFGGLYLLALVFLVTPLAGAEVEILTTSAFVATLSSAVFFVPVIVFFLAWVLLVVILTRASWWGYVIGGFFVGLLTYAGYLGGLLAVNAFAVAPSEVPQFLLDHLFDAPALLAFVLAREVPIWFGVWVGKRGRAVRVRNMEAREEYERLIEAGPSARV